MVLMNYTVTKQMIVVDVQCFYTRKSNYDCFATRSQKQTM